VEKLGINANPADMPGAVDDPGEPAGGVMRQNVRIRTVFGICTHRKKLKDGNLTDFCGSQPTGSAAEGTSAPGGM
jgi:hypothetical protein